MKQFKNSLFKNMIFALATIFTVQFSVPGVTNAQEPALQAAASAGLVANYSKIDLIKGNSVQVKLTYKGSAVDGTKATWRITSTAVATVKDGVVTAKSTGTTFLRVKYNGEELKIRITVALLDELEADDTSITLKKGKEHEVGLKFNNKSLSGAKARWSSSKHSVATVKDGIITAKGNGTAIITAQYSGQKVEIEVKVESNASGKLEADETEISMKKGEKETIKLTYDDDKLAGSKATWSTSKSSVATVMDGVVTAKGKGTAIITAKYKGEEVDIEVNVDVSGSGKLKAEDTKITLKKNEQEVVEITYDGETILPSKISWSTSKSSVATVSSNGIITGKGKGTATITAKYKGKEVEIEVKVEESEKLEADDTRITLKKGKKETIKLTYDGKSLSNSKATWSTSSSSVATVSNGVVKGKKKGTATIKAKYKGEEVEIKVTVK